MNHPTAFLANRMLAFALCFYSLGAARAGATVLPQARIDAALASAKNVHRRPPPNPGRPYPYYTVDGSDAKGYLNPALDDYGYLANGTDVLILPLMSDGSGGIMYTLLFTSIATKPAFIGYVPSPQGHLNVYIDEGRLLVETPVFVGNDLSCCPSVHHVVVYDVVGAALKKIDQYDVGKK
jgi:hypothetical protein